MVKSVCEVANTTNGEIFFTKYYHRPEPVKVIHNPPATIVYWDDGDKTVVKCQEMEKIPVFNLYDFQKQVFFCNVNGKEQYDPEKGLAIAFLKRCMEILENIVNILKNFVQ